ncbi:juvenile hormone esterase-like [Ochlerotatus camptorhynchus]|uniref:juvenile hormone esterase-like n=1 Tax=Ochlerotatus camptorhynchus TaxID=644619 RepID=UPI0031DA8A5B
MIKLRLLMPILVLNSIQPGRTNSSTQCLIWCNFGPAVQTPDGCLCGIKMNGLERGPFDAFMGIPFAEPPVGRLRFSNPLPLDPWEGYLNVSAPKPICIQKYDFYLGATVHGQEDCLYLNVYRPKSANDKPLPVMVFIHGGGYIGLSARPSLYGPEKFMDNRKVILVTIQYRLGALGFLSTDDRSAPGNFGLKDQALALQWVQRSIGSFGGDPRKVTIFGQGAGASSVQFHMMSPLSKGLFAKAISQSGSALSYWNEAYPDQLGLARRLALATGVDEAENINSWQLVNALRKVDATRLVNSVDELKIWHNQPIILFRPVVEKYVDKETFLDEDPKVLWSRGRYQKVPWMTGYLPAEGMALMQAIYTNSTLLQQLLANQQHLVPLLTGIPQTVVSDRYFGGTPISSANAIGLTRVGIEIP